MAKKGPEKGYVVDAEVLDYVKWTPNAPGEEPGVPSPRDVNDAKVLMNEGVGYVRHLLRKLSREAAEINTPGGRNIARAAYKADRALDVAEHSGAYLERKQASRFRSWAFAGLSAVAALGFDGCLEKATGHTTLEHGIELVKSTKLDQD